MNFINKFSRLYELSKLLELKFFRNSISIMHYFDFVGFKMPPKTWSGRTKTDALPHGYTSTGGGDQSLTLETGAPPHEQNEKIIGFLEPLSDT